MPWQCESCGHESHDDDAACDGCGEQKLTWTVVVDQTRTLVLSQKRFRVLKGTGTEQRPQIEPDLELVPTERAVALTKASALSLSDQGLLPASRNVLFVALHPRGATDIGVQLEVLFAGQPSREDSFPREASAGLSKDAVVYRRFLCVYGPEDASGLSFEGLEVVDVTEEEGYAPELEVAALGKPPVALAIGPVEALLRRFAFSV